jgi:selenide,water dikinase
MTDVTGFGLLGHLAEISENSNTSAEVFFDKIPLISPHLSSYIAMGSVPGGMTRNWDSYGSGIRFAADLDPAFARPVLADPQTSGGLLVSVNKDQARSVEELFRANAVPYAEIGRVIPREKALINVFPSYL